jgi:hypothetical protein
MMPIRRLHAFALTAVAAGLAVAGLTAAQAQGQPPVQSIYSVADGGLCVSVRGELDAFSPLVLARCNGQAAQLFRRDARTGKVQLHGRPELCIAGDFQPGDTNSSGMALKPCNENNEDRWSTNAAGNQFRTRFGTLGEFCWNVARPEAGQQLDARRCTGRPNQQFVFNTAGSGANATPIAPSNPAGQNAAGSASCPRGETPLRVTGLCPAEAAEAVQHLAQAPQAAPPAGPAVSPVSGPAPADLVESIYRSAMAGRDPFDKRTREQYLSRQLLRLIAQDEQSSARNNEPGKLEYSLLSGGQDELKISDLRVAEVSRQRDRVTVRVQFRNTAFPGSAPVETVTYQLQSGDRGWRITNIVYSAEQNLLSTLSR